MNTLIARIRGKLFTLRCRLFRPNISIGQNLRLFCRLSIQGRGKVTIGNNCTVRSMPGSQTQYVTLWTTSNEASITIGHAVQLNAAKLSCRFSITIGDHSVIEDASIMDSDFHTLDTTRSAPRHESMDKSSIHIGNNVGIASRSIVTKGVTLGDGCLVGPSSLVQRSFPGGSVVLGNPAKIIHNTDPVSRTDKRSTTHLCEQD